MGRIINIEEHNKIFKKLLKILKDENLTTFECMMILDGLHAYFSKY